jgi:hypothetical protein
MVSGIEADATPGYSQKMRIACRVNRFRKRIIVGWFFGDDRIVEIWSKIVIYAETETGFRFDVPGSRFDALATARAFEVGGSMIRFELRTSQSKSFCYLADRHS